MLITHCLYSSRYSQRGRRTNQQTPWSLGLQLNQKGSLANSNCCCHRQKSKTKSICMMNEDREPGPSQPADEWEIITESLSLESLHNLRKDLTWQPNESLLSWLIWVWDTASNGRIFNSTEARHLGFLSYDVNIDQGTTGRPEALSLGTQLLTSVKDRYLCPEDLQLQQGLWKTTSKEPNACENWLWWRSFSQMTTKPLRVQTW